MKTIAEHKLPLRLSEIMADARVRYKGSEAEKKFSNAAYAERCAGFSASAWSSICASARLRL